MTILHDLDQEFNSPLADLVISVYEIDIFPAGGLQTGLSGSKITLIGLMYHTCPLIGPGKIVAYQTGIVSGTVIYKDYFKIGVCLCCYAGKAIRQISADIVYRHHYAHRCISVCHQTVSMKFLCTLLNITIPMNTMTTMKHRL